MNVSNLRICFPGRSLLFIVLVVFLFLALVCQIVSAQNETLQSDTLAGQVQVDTAGQQQKEPGKSSDATSAPKEETRELSPPSISEIVSVPKIIWSLIFLAIGYFLIRLVIAFMNNIAKRNKRYEFAMKRAIPLVRILTWSFLVYLIIVGIFSPPAATLVAFLASIGVAVGFASQDLLKNVFGGLVVMFDRPFQIGDKIQAGDYYGEVVGIGIRSSKIVTPEDSLVTIPNSEFMTQYVANANSGENNCQVVAEVYLPINIDTEHVRDIATEAARVSRYIYLNKPIVILFSNEYRERRMVMKMKIKAYVSDLGKEFVFKSEMTEIVIRELLEQGILKPDDH